MDNVIEFPNIPPKNDDDNDSGVDCNCEMCVYDKQLTEELVADIIDVLSDDYDIDIDLNDFKMEISILYETLRSMIMKITDREYPYEEILKLIIMHYGKNE